MLPSPGLANHFGHSYMALKMLPRTNSGERELKIYRILKQQKCSLGIINMIDDFKIPHHRLNEGSDDFEVEFSVIVLPAMGPDLRRYYDESELSVDDQKDCIRSAVQGIAHIHGCGGVHGG
jgi:serine/threonine protein kinase